MSLKTSPSYGLTIGIAVGGIFNNRLNPDFHSCFRTRHPCFCKVASLVLRVGLR